MQIEVKNRRVFLKRIRVPNLNMETIFIGAKVTIYSRQFTIKSYGNDFTRENFETSQNVNKSFLLCKPDAYEHLGKIVTMLEDYNFIIANVKMIRFASIQDASDIIGSVTQSKEELEHVCSDLVVGFELVRDNAVDALNELVGHEAPVRAK